MSLISDIKGFIDNNNSTDFIITGYPNINDTNLHINITALLEFSVEQQNKVADKPLEEGIFTVDSKQIKPQQLRVKGVILPPANVLTFAAYQAYITNQIQRITNYANGTQLFSLSNLFTFGSYAPVTITGIAKVTNSDITIPEVVIYLMQVQTSTATNYSSTNTTPNVSEPTNAPPRG